MIDCGDSTNDFKKTAKNSFYVGGMDSMLFIQIALNNPAADECSGFMIAKEALAVLSSSCFDRLQRTMPYNMGMPYMPNTNGKTFV